MTPREEQYERFFNAAMIKVENMSVDELREYRGQLNIMERHARAGIDAANKKINELKRK